jgi:hypothetical protein
MLTAGPGSWSGTPAPTFAYKWSDGATGKTRTLGPGDVGNPVTVTVTAKNSAGTVAATSPSVGPVTGPPVNSSPPTIAGTPHQGDTLIASPGGWSGYPAPTFSYVWSDGTTGSTDTLSAADVGQNVSVTVVATNPLAAPSATSASVGPVTPAAAAPTNTARPTISGTAQQGATLTANPGAWSGTAPITYTYAWSDGTTGPTDTLTASDVGKSVSVTVTASNFAGGAQATSPTLGPVASPGPNTVATTTALAASPNPAVTNQGVTLIATVTSSNGAVAPSGSIAFKNGGAVIGGCANVAVAPTAQSVTVTCQTSFAAPAAQLTAVFAPSAGSNVTPSASATDSLVVARDSTTTTLDVSKTAYTRASTTYTATVAPSPNRPGTIEPTGSVEFFDGGNPIASCLSQPLSSGGATCAVTYNVTGTHSITAQYNGDANFTGSVAPSHPVSVVQLPPQVLGSLTSTMQWTFYYTPTYTAVRALVVNGASGATVTIKCQGKGCPFAARAAVVAKAKRCGTKGARRCPTHGTVDLTPQFRNRHLHAGALITVLINRRGWIGKYYSFTVRARRAPRIRISCLAPGGTRPGAGC